MSMSTNVIGLRSDDDPQFQAMKKVLLACNEAEIDMPREAAEYFGDKEPYFEHLEDALSVKIDDALEEYDNDMCLGYTVDLAKLPQGVKKLIFYNSY